MAVRRSPQLRPPRPPLKFSTLLLILGTIGTVVSVPGLAGALLYSVSGAIVIKTPGTLCVDSVTKPRHGQ